MTACTVLGSQGYIGRNLVAYLRSQGHTVWAPERGDAQVFGRELGHVFYCVGLTADFRTRPFDTVDAHVILLHELLRRAQFDSFVYLSSTRVYIGAVCTEEDAALTILPGDPTYIYNMTKLTGESLCHACGRAGVRVARLSNVVGPGMVHTSGNLVADLIHQARKGHIVLRSHPSSVKDYIHIDDVVQWLVLIALGGKCATYNVASGIQTKHSQWLKWLQMRTGCSVEVTHSSQLQHFSPIDVLRLKREFGVLARNVLTDDLL